MVAMTDSCAMGQLHCQLKIHEWIIGIVPGGIGKIFSEGAKCKF